MRVGRTSNIYEALPQQRPHASKCRPYHAAERDEPRRHSGCEDDAA